MMKVLAVHETDGDIVIIDAFYDSESKNLKIVYVKNDGSLGESTKGKFTISNPEGAGGTYVEQVKRLKVKSQ